MTGASAWLWDDASAPWRWASVAAWAIVLVVLLPTAWRLVTRQSRYLDPLLRVVLLLSLNRLSFLLRLSATGSHASAIMLAFVLAVMAWSYQRNDREVSR